MQVYTRTNGKRKMISSPRDLMNLKGVGAVYVYQGSDESEAARWAASIMYHIKAGGRVIGMTTGS